MAINCMFKILDRYLHIIKKEENVNILTQNITRNVVALHHI